MTPLRLRVWSDYLCPWCYNASVRLARLEEELGPALEIEWRAYLLRPTPRAPGDPAEDLRRFVRYTQSWLRPASEPDGGRFRVWETTEGPPSHSVPAHVAAKAAQAVGPDAFRRLHARLLEAYFAENRDVSRREVLRALWDEVGLPADAFERASDPALERVVRAEHEEALELGVTGVPAAQLAGMDAALVGALPLETYRRWLRRRLDEEAAAAG
ncbi:MAG TPA: DsbA family protein [Myxococcota bacterium]|nr:DsbA family protein [Myxococcota bacterium]